MNQNHTVNDTDLNKIYAFDKIAELLSNNKFEAVTNKEEIRGLHRDSETGKISECTYGTFIGETEYKLNLTSNEVWELLCYVLGGMDKVIDENGCQITKDAFGFKHEYNSEHGSENSKDDETEKVKEEVKEDGIDNCDNCNADNVDNSSCNFDNIPVSLSCDESNKVSVGYELVYGDDIDDFCSLDPYGEKPIKGINLYGVICDGTIYKDYFDIQGPENWSKFKEAIGASDFNEDLTYFNKRFNRYEIDWNRILQLYKESFYTSTGYRWIAKPCKNVIYNSKSQIDKQNRKFDESRISKITSKHGTLTAGYKKLYHMLTPDDKKNKINGNNDNVNDSYVIGVKLYAIDSAGVYYNDYFSFFDNFEFKDGGVYAKLDGCKNFKKMGQELGVYDVVQADGSKIELIKWNQDENGENHFEYDWDTILTAYKSAFYDCFGYRRKDKGGMREDESGMNGSLNGSKPVIKEYSSWHTVDCDDIVCDDTGGTGSAIVNSEWKGYNKEWPFYDE